jgi:hypothetical protein
MISFSDFQILLEGKKKKLKKELKQYEKDLNKHVDSQRASGASPVEYTAGPKWHGHEQPNSPHIKIALQRMMADNSAHVKELKRRQKASQSGTQSVDSPEKP